MGKIEGGVSPPLTPYEVRRKVALRCACTSVSLPFKYTDHSPGCTAYSTMHRETANVADPVLLPLSVEVPKTYAKNTTSVHGFSDLCYNVTVASG